MTSDKVETIKAMYKKIHCIQGEVIKQIELLNEIELKELNEWTLNNMIDIIKDEEL